VSEISRSAARRVWRLAGLPAAHAGRAAVGLGRRVGGRPAELVWTEVQARSAAQLFEVLGELKGGAMKVGQAMAAMEAAMPVELAGPYRDALTRLVETVPALPASMVHDALGQSFGSDWRERFIDFDDRPAVAASLGQVHRAMWHDGTDVAVKVRYPGIADALSSDLRQLHRLAPLVRLGAPGIDPRGLFAELGERLTQELDYPREAATQRAFAEAFSGDRDFVVPSVVMAAEGVLVTEWVDATPLVEVIDRGSPAQRNHAGLLLLRLFLSSPERVGRIHGDPHPGNFAVRGDGRLVVFDFGSSEPLANRWPPALGRLLRAGRDRDTIGLHAEAVAAGLLEPDDVTPASLHAVLDPWFEPLRIERFRFERSWLQREARAWSNPRGAAARLMRKARVPVRHLLVQRVAFGLLGVLTSLDATVPVRAEAQRWLPGLR
jgi:predicted unusual protein kinase regulating ubiquinone biosynthesis (AarF/ABC1/UbiB family)